jgi:hypothetical protein
MRAVIQFAGVLDGQDMAACRSLCGALAAMADDFLWRHVGMLQ